MALAQFITQFLGNNSAIADVVRVVNNLQRNLQQIFTQFTKQVQNNSILLSGLTIQVGNNVITHTLGQAVSGYSVVSCQTAFPELVVYKPSDNQYLYVSSKVAATNVTLLVF